MKKYNMPVPMAATTARAPGRLGGRAAAAIAMTLFAAGVARADVYVFNNLIGNAVAIDHTDGTGGNARFLNSTGVAVDGAGNIYVADGGDHTVRKVTTAGVVTTLAGGSGQGGSADGTGTDARFVYPYALAVDGAGNVFVTDTGNHNIRKITAGGAVTTLAGTAGVVGSTDGTTALFNLPQGIAVDATGNIYVADTNNSTIRKIGVNGVVTTLAGVAGQTGGADGTGAAARFNYPFGLAVDAAGNLYAADFGNSTIRKITADGMVTTLAGSAGLSGSPDGLGGGARFDHPSAVAVDSAGNVYVIDTSNQTVRKISAGGSVSTLAGTAGTSGRADGTGAAARFFYPAGIAVTGAGAIYVADTGNHTLRVVTAAGAVTTLAGAAGVSGIADGVGGEARFAYPDGVAVDGSGNLFIADHDNHTIRKMNPAGGVTTLAGAAGISGNADGAGGAARFSGPTGVAVDGSGNVYVADAGNTSIRKISANGTVTTFAGVSGVAGSSDGAGAAARFNAPQGIAVDSAGNVYVADTNNSTIRKVTAGGTVTTLAGVAGQNGSSDGPGGSARFNGPYAVAVDSGGNVYVADFRNATIRKITAATGTVTTLAGLAGQVGFTDGLGGAARFNQPYGVTVDGSGNVFVADTYNRAVRKITAAGAVTTLNGTNSRFYYPQGIAADGAGNLYVADGDNQAVFKGELIASPPSGGAVASPTVTSGEIATFSLGAANSQTTYQWQVSTNAGATWAALSNNSTYGGATTVTLTAATTIAMNGNRYRAQLTNAAGTSVSGTATLTVSAPPTQSDARLFAISCRAVVGTGGDVLIPGIIISGSGQKQVIVRASGPALIPQGVAGTLAQPQLRLYSGQTVIAENIGWSSGTAANTSALQAAFTQNYLSQFPTGSADCALLATLAPGVYTAIISGTNNTAGVALVEVYENGASTSRLSAISCRAVVGTGGNVLIPGIIITGTNPKPLIIRAGGPLLASLGVTGTLAQPQLQLFNAAGVKIAENTGWGTAANVNDLATATAAVGLTPFQTGSADCAILTTLAPGAYTAIISGVNNTTGVALIEVYEAP